MFKASYFRENNILLSNKKIDMKNKLKYFIHAFFKIIVFPIYILYLIEAPFLGKKRAFTYLLQIISLFPGLTGEFFRKAILEWIIGGSLIDSSIGFGTLFSDHRVKIGEFVYIGPKCDIGYVEIGNNTLIGSSVHLLSGVKQHLFSRVDLLIREQGGEIENIIIGDDVWIGNSCLITANIGRGAIVGAGSVVLAPVPDFAVVAGNPATIKRFRR